MKKLISLCLVVLSGLIASAFAAIEIQPVTSDTDLSNGYFIGAVSIYKYETSSSTEESLGGNGSTIRMQLVQANNPNKMVTVSFYGKDLAEGRSFTPLMNTKVEVEVHFDPQSGKVSAINAYAPNPSNDKEQKKAL